MAEYGNRRDDDLQRGPHTTLSALAAQETIAVTTISEQSWPLNVLEQRVSCSVRMLLRYGSRVQFDPWWHDIRAEWMTEFHNAARAVREHRQVVGIAAEES